MKNFALRNRATARLLAALILIPALASGCGRPDPDTSRPDGTPLGRQQVLDRADQLISDGRRLRQRGADLRQAGQAADGERLMAQGDELILRGEQVKDKGLMLP